MHLPVRNVMSRQVPISSLPSCEPATKRSFAAVATAKRSESAVKAASGFPVSRSQSLSVLSADADSARRPSGSAATAIPRPPLARAESELFRRRCLVIDNWMRLRRNPLLQSRRGDDFAPRLQGRGIGAYRFGGTMPNGTSSDQETIEATIAPFYHAIGRATARWQHVE